MAKLPTIAVAHGDLRDFLAASIHVPWDQARALAVSMLVEQRKPRTESEALEVEQEAESIVGIGEIVAARATIRYAEADAMMMARKLPEKDQTVQKTDES